MWFVLTTAIRPALPQRVPLSGLRPRLVRVAGLAMAWLGAAASLACDSQQPLLCGQIPDGGCPIGRGGTCEDAFCEALYDCVQGDWTEVEVCERPSGGGGAGAGGEGGGGSNEGGCAIVTFDHTGEVRGCEPDLQPPDCPVEAAEVCEPCITGCVDFFLCVESEAGPLWTTVAYCSEDGALVVER